MRKKGKLITSILVGSIVFLNSCNTKEQPEKDFTQYVNPFLGAAEYGHCFPGACIPFGLIQVGAETGNCAWEYCSGYQSSDSTINGFSQTRLNGTGCPDLGDLLMFPFTGDAERESYTSLIDKQSEFASPGYYSATLTDFNVDAEMTASEHVAFHSYSFPSDEAANLLIDFQSATVGNKPDLHSHVLDAKVNFDSPTTISGYSTTRVWLERTYYYTIEFNYPIKNKIELPARDENEKASRYVINFDIPEGEKLMVKVGLSSTSVEAAKANLAEEVNHWDFEKVRTEAKNKWNDFLSGVEIEGDTDQKTLFYTSMYRLFIQPNNIGNAGGEPFYSTLSLWDTYRAAHPLYTIVSPEKVDDFVNSMLRQHDEQGFLPIWALWGKETYCMIGNHAVPVIVDAYLKGFKGFDAERAFSAVKLSLTKSHNGSDWEVYDKYGYYPFDLMKNESVSKTLECSYDDYCAAMFAEALGKEDEFNFFHKRSEYYKNLFDPETKLMRGKDSNGEWRTPFNTFVLAHASTSGGDYTEGNAWQYTWHVQHDVDGLIDLMGSKDYFTTKLDSLFELAETQEGSGFVSDVTGLIGQYAHGNEPSHHVAYLYTLAGKPEKTQELVNKIMKTKYINEIDGLCGNDDCGQMSAWYIFTSLGFYPANPCGGEFVIGAPQLQKAVINLPDNKKFTVESVNYSKENIYVQSIKFNGQEYTKNTITYDEIMSGGKLEFTMGSAPKN